MKFICIFFIISAACFSCDEAPQTEKKLIAKDADVIEDTTGFVKDSSKILNYADSLFSGAYQGIFPCPNCDGIQQTILFTKEKTFKQEQMTWDKNETQKSSSGTWEKESDTIKLFQNDRPVMDLIRSGDSLFPVYISGIKLKSPMNYVLAKRTLAINNALWQRKEKAGIDFVGTGNEPFWSLEIDNHKYISFRLGDWKKPIFVRRAKPIVSSDSIFYKLKSDTSNWTITILPEFCNDGMSDYLYQYKVNVNYKGIRYKGCGVMLSGKSHR